MPANSRQVTAVVWLVCSALTLVFPACQRAEVAVRNGEENPRPTTSALVVVYRNDFNGPIGETFPEWTSPPVTFIKTATGEKGSLPAGAVAIVESPNGRERFLGEFGGPARRTPR